jgi:hypothetical protein
MCLAGTADGPDSGTCGDGWLTEGDLASCANASCAAHSDCESCRAASGCGFCGTTGKCIAGSSTGPASQWGSCDIDGYQYNACPSDCASASDCWSCTMLQINNVSDVGCGWCGVACLPGSPVGPTDPAACGGEWESSVFQCI